MIITEALMTDRYSFTIYKSGFLNKFIYSLLMACITLRSIFSVCFHCQIEYYGLPNEEFQGKPPQLPLSGLAA